LQEKPTDEVVRFAFTGQDHQRDGVVAGLLDAVDKDGVAPALVQEIAQRLLQPAPSSPVARLLRPICFPWESWVSRRAMPAVLSGRQVAFELAYHCNFPNILAEAAGDRADVVRALLIPYLFRY
jgi:hypothetical protein